MGGGAFAQAAAQGEPTLNTPRMKPEEYARVKSIYLRKLQDYFPDGKVVCLTEAPEKTDYGDMDIFVALDQLVDFKAMASHLGAAGIINYNPQKCTLGVPREYKESSRPVVVYEHVQTNGAPKDPAEATITEEEYAQIDVEVVTPSLLEWHTFYSSYGDMVGLLGHMVHNLGFTISDRGLWLRMKELDLSKTVQYVNVADRDGTILLSHEPKLVMQFLGLSVNEYEAGFDTLNAFFQWLSACRLLSVDATKLKRDNAHERNREQKRTVFSRFFKEWLPAHMDMSVTEGEHGQIDRLGSLRKRFQEEAVEFFGMGEDYGAKHSAIVLTVNNATAANLLKPLIAQHSQREGKHLNEIIRAFRRYVEFDGNGIPHVLETPHSDAASQLHHFLAYDTVSLADEQATDGWVGAHWEVLRMLERHRSKTGTIESV